MLIVCISKSSNLQGIYPKMASFVEGFGLFKQALRLFGSFAGFWYDNFRD